MERWQMPEAEKAQAGTGDHPSRSSLDYNTPLRSVRGDAASTASPFYKLSAELSRESLRVPGAVPFVWEQCPGRRKFSLASPPSVISPHSIIMQKPPTSSVMPESTIVSAVDPAKPSLETLFRQPSLKGVVGGIPAAADSRPDAPVPSAIPQISPPPAADRPRSSSARYIVMQRNMPPGTSFNNAALQADTGDDDDDVSEENISDVFTATAGEGLSMDNSLMLSGPLRPASTPSEARDFIMHRFLPAAHTIACESPHTPSRRFLLPVGIAAPCSPSTPARCNGSFRDYTAASRPSPLRYASTSSTPASNARQVQHGGQLHTGSFHGKEQEEEEEEEDVEEEPPFTPKACGIFPFRITLTFYNRHNTGGSSRRSPSFKHQHNKQQHQKKGSKSMNCAGSPMRIMDILHDDHSSSHDDESHVYRLRSKQSDTERERTKIAVLEQAGLMRTFNDRRLKPPLDSYNRESANLRQLLTAQQGASELYSEEASEYGSYQDAPSRFQSPSPAACHLNARAMGAYNMQPPRVSGIAQRSRSFAGLQGDMSPSAAIISTTEQHLLNSSFYYYNMHTSINKPHYQAQFASSSTYHTPLSSQVDASHQSCPYHDNINSDNSSKGSYHDIKSSFEKANHNDNTTNAEQWDTSNHLAPNTHIINNALFEHEDQETNMIANTNCPSMFTTVSEHEATYSPNCLNQGSSFNQAGPGVWQGYGEIDNINGDHYVSKGEHHVSRGDPCLCKGSIGNFHSSSGNHHMINGDLHGGQGHHHVSNASHYVSNGCHQGDHYVSNNHHYASKDDPHCAINGDNHVSEGVQYVSNGNNHVSNGDIYVSNGDVHGKLNSSFLSTSLLSPPLPKSPTHSWLGRAIPLVASTNKSLGASSRLSHMQKATTPGDEYVAPVSMSKTKKQGHLGSTEGSKWEALVKGSHLQPGHLRFSEELYHQSQSVMKVGAS